MSKAIKKFVNHFVGYQSVLESNIKSKLTLQVTTSVCSTADQDEIELVKAIQLKEIERKFVEVIFEYLEETKRKPYMDDAQIIWGVATSECPLKVVSTVSAPKEGLYLVMHPEQEMKIRKESYEYPSSMYGFINKMRRRERE